MWSSTSESFFNTDVGPIETDITFIDIKNKGRIDDILVTLKIDPMVKDLTKKYYEMLDANPIRIESKLMAVFYCVLCAQETLGETYGICPAVDLANELGMDKKRCEAAMKKFQGRLRGVRPVGYVDPIITIRSVARLMNWTDATINEITDEWNSLVEVSPRLKEVQPIKIAAGYLFYYIKSAGCVVGEDALLKRFKLNKKQLLDAEQLIVDAVILLRSSKSPISQQVQQTNYMSYHTDIF